MSNQAKSLGEVSITEVSSEYLRTLKAIAHGLEDITLPLNEPLAFMKVLRTIDVAMFGLEEAKKGVEEALAELPEYHEWDESAADGGTI